MYPYQRYIVSSPDPTKYNVLYSAKFSRRTIFADRVVGSVSQEKFSPTKEILLATPRKT